MLAVLHALGAVLLFLASSQAVFGPLYLLVLLYAIAYMPTVCADELAGLSANDATRRCSLGRSACSGLLDGLLPGCSIGSLKLEATAMPMRLRRCRIAADGDL